MKKKNVCGRCGLIEKRGLSFEAVFDFYLCGECSQLAYRAKDAKAEGNTVQAQTLSQEFQQGIIESPVYSEVTAWAKLSSRE